MNQLREMQSYARPAARASIAGPATVTDLAARRRSENVLETVSLVFGGVHYGTVPLNVPYTSGKPLMLFIVPSRSAPETADDLWSGPVDCLITDDPALARKDETAAV